MTDIPFGISLRNEGFDEPAGPRHLIVSVNLPDGREVDVIREYFGDGGISHSVTETGIAAAIAQAPAAQKARRLSPAEREAWIASDKPQKKQLDTLDGDH